MGIQDFSFLTDENIDAEVVSELREAGYNVFDIKEEGLFRLSDAAILELSFTQRRIIISQDSDFGTLIYRDKMSYHGIIFLRPGHESPQVHVQSIQAILSANIIYSFPFILVAENTGESVRIRLRTE